jgi:hypothetical protein
MNYSEAISYIFQDKDWVKKILLGGLCVFIAVFTGILFFAALPAIGYYVGVLRNVMKGEEKPLPEWKDWNKFFADGLLGAIILFIYFLVIGGLGAIIIVNFAMGDMEDYERVLGIVFTAIGILIALALFGNLGLIRFAATNDFGAAFRFAEISQLLKNDFGNYMSVVIFASILNAILFLAGLGIFSPFTNFWGYMVQAHLFGQYAKVVNSTIPTVPTAS